MAIENRRPATLAALQQLGVVGVERVELVADVGVQRRRHALLQPGRPAREPHAAAAPGTSAPSASQWSTRLRMNSGLPPARRARTGGEAVRQRARREAPAQVRLDRGVGQAADGERLGDAAHAQVVGQRGDRGLAVLAGRAGTCRARAAAPGRGGAAPRRAGRASSRRPSAGPPARARTGAAALIASSASSISRSIRARVAPWARWRTASGSGVSSSSHGSSTSQVGARCASTARTASACGPRASSPSASRTGM